MDYNFLIGKEFIIKSESYIVKITKKSVYQPSNYFYGINKKGKIYSLYVYDHKLYYKLELVCDLHADYPLMHENLNSLRLFVENMFVSGKYDTVVFSCAGDMKDEEVLAQNLVNVHYMDMIYKEPEWKGHKNSLLCSFLEAYTVGGANCLHISICPQMLNNGNTDEEIYLNRLAGKKLKNCLRIQRIGNGSFVSRFRKVGF